MFTEQEEKAFVVIDNFLNELTSSSKGGWFNTYGKPTEYFLAKELMDKYRLITYRNLGSKMSIVDIGDNGLTIIKTGGIKKYLLSNNQKSEEKENLELQRLRLENEKLVNELVDFPKVKSQRNWLFVIAAVELLAILIGLILQLKGKLL